MSVVRLCRPLYSPAEPLLTGPLCDGSAWTGHLFAASLPGDSYPERRLPRGDGDLREARFGGQLAKPYLLPALDQGTFLAVFEEEAWSPRIDDPLRARPEQGGERRLHQTPSNQEICRDTFRTASHGLAPRSARRA